MRLITKTDGIMRFLAGQPTEKICAKPAEIRECGLTEKEFDAAQKRLRRGLNRIEEGGRR